MKVIKNNFKEPKWQVVCPHCGSILEYEKNDVVHNTGHFFDLHYIKCPCCDNSIDVNRW